ncbi:MAG: FtsX-like permease family protein [Anaerolineae bacterium]|nr:MAG: FtsX-like permease family protein [Anaerolineae bacterium]
MEIRLAHRLAAGRLLAAFRRLADVRHRTFHLCRTAQSVEISTRTEVSEHWRGAYDLLVRPPQAVSPLEKETGLVEGNYLGVPQGGITLEQYRLIAGMSSVETAAPVATLGYLLNQTGQVSFKVPPPEKGVLYHLRVRLSGEAEEFNRQWESFWMRGEDAADVVFAGSQPDSLIGGKFLQFAIGNLPMQWTLLAGIDPAQEARLVHLPDTLTNGDYLPLEPELRRTVGSEGTLVPEIPLIVSRNAFLGDVRLSVQMETVPAGAFSLQDGDLSGAQEHLQGGTPTSILSQTLPLENNLPPLSGVTVLFAPGQSPQVGEEGMFNSVDFGMLLYPGQADYTPLTNLPAGAAYAHAFAVRPLGTWGEVVEPQVRAAREVDLSEAFLSDLVSVSPQATVFRPLEPRRLPPFAFRVRGRYDFTALAPAQDPLAYAPLGIYEPPVCILQYDETGSPLPGKRYYPSLNPGGFLPRPPLALTTLEAVHYLSGREDFIDAIRVRLADIDAYTPENLAKVESVAAEIAERTGLHVDIVAGSSPQKVLVQVPGTGYVEETWTTLGAAVQVSGGMTSANALLLGGLLLASTLFVAETSQVALLGRYREIGTLRAAGWSAEQILWYLLIEALSMGVLAGALGVLASLALNLAAGLHITGGTLAGVFLLGTGAYLAGAVFPAWRVTLRWPVALLQHGEMSLSAPRHSRGALRGMAGIALRQAWTRRARFLLTALIVAAGMTLSVFILGILWGLHGRLNVTLLGTFVSMHVRSYHLLMALIVLGMSFLAVLGNLLLSVTERAAEFALLRAAGWRRAQLSRLVFYEALWNVAAGALPGALGALLVLQVVIPAFSFPWAWLLLAALAVSLGMATLAAWYPVRRLARLMPARVLSAEGRRLEEGNEGGAGLRFAAILAATAAALAVTMLLGGRGDVARHAAGLDLTPTPTLPAAQQEAPLEEAMQHLAALADLGPRSVLQPEAQKAAADYIARTLQGWGWQVERQAIPTDVLDLLASDGKRVLQIPTEEVYLGGMAVHFSRLRLGEPLRAPLLWLPADAPPPAPGDLDGKIVLLVDESGMVRPGGLLTAFVQKTDASAAAAIIEVLPLESGTSPSALLEEAQPTEGRLHTAQNLAAFLAGQEGKAPLWLAAPYVTTADSPGASSGASGSAALLTWAHRLAEQSPARPVRLLFFGGNSADGLLSFLHVPPPETPATVLFYDALGDWQTLAYTSRLDAPDALQLLGDKATIAQQQASGQFMLSTFWLTLLDLDAPNLAAQVTDWQARSTFGLSQTPNFLARLAEESAVQSGVPVEAHFSADCAASSLFLLRDYPALDVCSAGNSRLRTPYDTLDTIDRQAYRQALAFGYQLIQNLLESDVP